MAQRSRSNRQRGAHLFETVTLIALVLLTCIAGMIAIERASEKKLCGEVRANDGKEMSDQWYDESTGKCIKVMGKFPKTYW